MRNQRRQWSLASGHFVHLDQRDAGAGPVGAADLGRVGPRRQSQNQRRVFAAVRERKGSGVPPRLRRDRSLGADRTSVIVFSDERGTSKDPQAWIDERTRDRIAAAVQQQIALHIVSSSRGFSRARICPLHHVQLGSRKRHAALEAPTDLVGMIHGPGQGRKEGHRLKLKARESVHPIERISRVSRRKTLRRP